MKTKIFTLILVLISLSACHKEVKIKVDKLNEVANSPEWNIDVHYSVFSTTEQEMQKKYSVLNSKVSQLVEKNKTTFMEQTKLTNVLLDSINIKQSAPYQLLINDTVFLANPQYISLLISSYSMVGGANGITSFHGINYDTKNQKILENKEILNYNKATEINALLKKHLNDPNQCYTFEDPTIENFNALNISLHSIEFTYGKYILGPGACGSVTISVPQKEMQGMLTLK